MTTTGKDGKARSKASKGNKAKAEIGKNTNELMTQMQARGKVVQDLLRRVQADKGSIQYCHGTGQDARPVPRPDGRQKGLWKGSGTEACALVHEPPPVTRTKVPCRMSRSRLGWAGPEKGLPPRAQAPR